MPNETSLEPRFVAWPCDHCRNRIEFDAVQLAGRASCRVPCPHCGQETSLQEPPPPPPLIPDEGWTQPAQPENLAVLEPANSAAEPPSPPPAPPVMSKPVEEISPGESTTIFMPKPITVSLPPDPLPPTLTRAPVDVRWLTDLGVVYFRQHQFGEAFLCFRRAAEQGFATAQFCLAVCYFNGHGTARDEAAALPWLQPAAAQGDANAEFTLGLAYSLGRGIAPDPLLASEWLQQAAAHGHPEAIRRVREMSQTSKVPTKTAPAARSSVLPGESALEKNLTKSKHDLQRLIFGLFRKK